MKRFFRGDWLVCLFALILIAVLAWDNADARFSGGRSGGSFSRSSSSFSRSSSSSRSSYSKSSSTPSRNTTKSSSLSKSSLGTKKNPVTKTVAPKNKMDLKKQKMMAAKDKTAFKKYGDKKTATAAYRKELASKNSYTSKEPPAQRPAHIPNQVTVNNVHVNTSYGMISPGIYGYGYMDPLTMTFIAVAQHQMMVDAMAMRSAGYGNWDAQGRPVVTTIHEPMPMVLKVIIGVAVVAAIVGIIVVAALA